MANPLFVTDLATLKSRLRLSGLSTDGDGASILDAAIQEVRVGFIREIGIDSVNRVVAYNQTETPTTNEEAIRLLAEILEVKWSRLILMRTMTTMTLDGAGGALNDYHHEAPFRETSPYDREVEISRLQKEIHDGLDLLSQAESIPDEMVGYQSFTASPDPTPPLPGESVFDYLLE